MTGRLIPARRAHGATTYLLAIMMFVMTMTAAAGLALFNGSRLVGEAAAGQHIVQLPGGIERSDDLANFLDDRDEVASARAVPPEEVRSSLERWLGGVQSDLPLPALVEVVLLPGHRGGDLEGKLAEPFPGASVASYRANLSPILGALRTVALGGLGLVLAIALAAAAAIVLATRAAIAANRSTINILHGMGASDEQVAASFVGKIARDALVGGGLGTVLALLLLSLLAQQGGDRLSFLVGGAELMGLADLLLLLALPFLAAAMAFLVARLTILGDLRREP